MTADGLSTGLFVLGENKALEVAEKENIPVYLIMKTEQGFETKNVLSLPKSYSQIRNNHANFIFYPNRFCGHYCINVCRLYL